MSGALGTSTYAYDGANNLRFVNKGGASQAEYAYDGLNQRVWTHKLPSPTASNPNPSTAVKSYEIYSSNGQLLVEYSPSLAKVDEHVYLGTKRIGLASRSTTNTPSYSCPVGQSLIGSGAASQCIQTLTTASVLTSYRCHAGQTVSGSNCPIPTSMSANKNCVAGTTWVTNTWYIPLGQYRAVTGQSICLTPELATGSPGAWPPSCYALAGMSALGYRQGQGTATSGEVEFYNYCAAYKPLLSCPAGQTLSGSNCLGTVSVAASPNYSCPASYSAATSPVNASTTCSKPQSTAATYSLTGAVVNTQNHFHLDPAATPLLATTAAGTVVWKETHRPYGDKHQPSLAGASNTIGFASKPFDNATGLSYMGARYYHPALGRFMAMDPVGFQEGNVHSHNRYTYANNNPYKFVDPDGRNPVAIAVIGAIGISLAAQDAYNGYQSGGWAGAANSVATTGAFTIAFGVVGNAVSKSVQAAKSAVTVSKSVAVEAAPVAKEGGRNANKLGPDPKAEGPHSVSKTDKDGKITNTATYTPNPQNPKGFDESKRVDIVGKAHRNPDGTVVSTPHVHETGVKGVRAAEPSEMPSSPTPQ